ncbi:MAG: hypothetical protein Q7T12_08095 [Flavobacterium sp.]|nr:hypothetical protein [Flavobacterium sp.]
MKKTILFSLFLFVLSCGKQTENFNMPIFAFIYVDSQNDYTLKYSGKDTLYLTDEIQKKNFYSVLDKIQGKEIFNIITEIKKPEYFSYKEYGNINKVYFKFSILNEEEMPKSFPYRKDAEKEMFNAAAKVNRIKCSLNFVETEKEYMLSQME